MSSLESYQVFPKHVGCWEGTVKVLDPNLQETRAYKIHQEFADRGQKWVITNTYSFGDGTSTSHSFDVIPTGNGRVKVETRESRFQATTMEAVEEGEDIVIFQVINATTGQAQEVETIVLPAASDPTTRPQARTRTAQLFDANGQFQGLLMITEQRVGDVA